MTTCWVEYWNKDRELMRVITSYVPKKGDFVKIKTKRMKSFQFRKIIEVVHSLDESDTIKEKFLVFVN